ncbi:flagellar hook-associated 2-like protein [Catenovulum agarivorans DS-2]|uniref:Flagellar hook-associated protein 2 n=1 Tax=Catenovulum agarivorans DS-2 TaxID=1328313 RepID=W7QW13_9ALTE|nr:flagellar filament capping protein FliD [Catenovulum agarivorans]EWH09465.1 flagellar hook-associated 2-like protein [Catenovulum agarivorans DS-2]
MSVSSIGVGSGLDLSGLVQQLLEAERKPKQDRFDSREEDLEAVISGIGALKSKMDEFKSSVDDLRSSYELQGRKAMTTHPDASSDSEASGPFTAEASNSATAGTYDITIEQLAAGSRIQTADSQFASSSSSVSASAGTLTFKIDSTGDSFTVNVTSGMTLAELRSAVNNASGNDFGINASIIDTGTAAGAKLVFSSETTGAGNDLKIVNDNDIADLEHIATVDSTETTTYGNVTTINATNAQATIDDIAVESENNTFENVIENVSFEALELSSTDSLGNFQASTLEVGYDKDGLKNKITDFVDNYNSLISEIKTLTRYGTSELEEDGALAGDYMARSIQSGLDSIITSSVSSSSLGTLFQIGVSFDDDGKLQISETDEFGLGSGQEMLDDALDDYYDEIASLFADDDEGIANKLYDFVYEYTTFGGLLRTREQSFKDQKELLNDDRARFEVQMADYEQLLRNKYINLDLTVAKLQRTGSALNASLSTAFF